MADWERDTPWRQGQLFTAESAALFGLRHDEDPDKTAAVVISHDCDLAQTSEVEPNVEVIVGRFLDEGPQGNYLNCKNVRRLHVECGAGVVIKTVELDATRRTIVSKDSSAGKPGLADHRPCAIHRMTAKERNTLQVWLASRYRRAAFPDEFDRRLRDTGVADRLARSFKDSGKYVTAVFFDVDEGQERVRAGVDDVY